jgi:hypothetical protein
VEVTFSFLQNAQIQEMVRYGSNKTPLNSVVESRTPVVRRITRGHVQ